MTRSVEAHVKRIEFLILMTLAKGPAHGYGMVTAIREASGGAVSLEPGNLYRRIRALEEAGFVTPAEPRYADDSNRRRYYALTDAGREAFVNETARLEELAATAGAIAASVSR